MRESLGGSLLFSIVVTIGGLVMAVFVSILAYSKAYRVKNNIIEIIESKKYYNSDIAADINENLKEYGYDASSPTKCSEIQSKLWVSDKAVSQNFNKYGYNYCVFQVCEHYVFESGNKRCAVGEAYHYVVVTFVQFEIPIIHDIFSIPVYSETKKLGKVYDY